MNYKTIAIAFAALSLPLLSYAHSSPDQVKVCYSFAGDTLEQTQSCIVSLGGGAGGVYENIKIGNKYHLFEGACDMDGECDYSYYPGGPDSNIKSKQAISYLRDGTFHTKVKPSEAANANHLLYCYKTKNGSLDICTN